MSEVSEISGSFLDALMSGDALPEDIDDWVSAWHDGDDDRSLDAYLGFTPREGALWAEKPDALRLIAMSHRLGHPLDDLLNRKDMFALAARAGDGETTQEVLFWLEHTGRLDGE